MNLIDLFRDQRNPLYFFKLLKTLPQFELPSAVSFIFTMDVELGPDESYATAEKQTTNVLDFFNDYGHGTFFVDTDLLEHDAVPSLGKNEVGNHGYQHSAVGNNWWLRNEDKKYDPAFIIEKSTALIKDHLNELPVSFRAPKFSIAPPTFSLLKKYGYSIDSSLAPFNDQLFPVSVNGMLEIPVSRVPKPHWHFSGFPHLRYDSLMVNLLKAYGVEKFSLITQQILSCWHGQKHPMLCFMGHPWEFDAQTFDLLRDYLDQLEKNVKVRYITLKEYSQKIS